MYVYSKVLIIKSLLKSKRISEIHIIRKVNKFVSTWKKKFPQDRGRDSTTKINFPELKIWSSIYSSCATQKHSRLYISKVIFQKECTNNHPMPSGDVDV